MKYGDVEWSKAACKGLGNQFVLYDPVTFSEIDPEPRYQAVCNDCLIIKSCYAYALANYVDGWWGGTSSRHRDRIRRKERAKNTAKKN
jgi:hypothetical protein